MKKILKKLSLFLAVTIQNTHYPKIKSGVPEIAFLIAS